MATEPRRRNWLIGWRQAMRGLMVGGISALAIPSTFAQQPSPLPKNLASTPVSAAPKTQGVRVVAYIYGNVQITRDELHDFLIARGGMEKLELLVNRKIIEAEAGRRGVGVTPEEVEAGLLDDLRGIGVTREEFANKVLPKYGKTLFEWQYDVIRPRLLLAKLCHGRIQVTPEEVQRLFEHRHGEKREAQVITFEKSQAPPLDVREAARNDPAKFEALAKTQPGDLGAAGGRINPVGRHIEGEHPQVEAALFNLKVGEISPWIETPATPNTPAKLTCIRLLRVIPPDPAATLDRYRASLEKDLYDVKVNAEIPKVFAEMKRVADPRLTVHVPVPPAPPVPPGQEPPPPPVRIPCDDPRVLAVIYGKYTVTREDLGEFLLLRGGYEKLDLLVNRRIIDVEAARRGITVTPEEVEAALNEELKGLPPGHDGQPITKEIFVTKILPMRKLSLFEWTEDVIRPRLTLRKMCADRVRVTPEDLQKAFENQYGEKREARIIIWAKHELRLANKQWDEARQGDDPATRDANFDRIARGQQDANLAAAAGKVAPIGRHTDAENPIIEKVVFGLKEGEVSHLFETTAGIMCVKCVKFIPPIAGVNFEQVRPRLEKETYEKKMAREIPAYFSQLKEQAKPNVLMKGPPSPRENEEGVQQLIQQVGGIPPESKR